MPTSSIHSRNILWRGGGILTIFLFQTILKRSCWVLLDFSKTSKGFSNFWIKEVSWTILCPPSEHATVKINFVEIASKNSFWYIHFFYNWNRIPLFEVDTFLFPEKILHWNLILVHLTCTLPWNSIKKLKQIHKILDFNHNKKFTFH